MGPYYPLSKGLLNVAFKSYFPISTPALRYHIPTFPFTVDRCCRDTWYSSVLALPCFSPSHDSTTTSPGRSLLYSPLTQALATTMSSCGTFCNILQIAPLEPAESNIIHCCIFMTPLIILIAVHFLYIFAHIYLLHF